MSAITGLAVIFAAFATAVLSGVFGMAGGLVLMGVLALLLPVPLAFVAHGILQLAANGSRAVLHRAHVNVPVLGWFAAASAIAGALVMLISFVPSQPLLFLLLGLVPGLVWLPPERLRLDAARPPHAFLCGLTVTGLNLTAGVAGPLLDVFFVRTGMTRHQIVATKAATQVFSHAAKIAVYGVSFSGLGGFDLAMLWPILLALPLSVLGTTLGGRILDGMTDKSFLSWTKGIITAIGALYLIQAAVLMLR